MGRNKSNKKLQVCESGLSDLCDGEDAVALHVLADPDSICFLEKFENKQVVLHSSLAHHEESFYTNANQFIKDVTIFRGDTMGQHTFGIP